VSRPRLTDLEMTVLRRAVDGYTTAATARSLGKSMPAVQDARHRLLVKLGAQSMPQAVWLACRAGVLEPQRRHGDRAGYRQHERRGEPACDGCKAGNARYHEARRARQREAA